MSQPHSRIQVALNREKDPEILRQIALLVDSANLRLLTENARLRAKVAELSGSEEDIEQLEIQLLEDLLRQAMKDEQAPVGDTSEKPSKPPTEKARPPRPGHGPRAQQNLPVVEKRHELDEQDRKCSKCGKCLEEMGEQSEDSEVISVRRCNFVLERHTRQKYRCRCNANVVTAPGPEKLIEGGRYSVGFACTVAMWKYLDHLPLSRQVQMMGRESLEISSQTLWDQIDRLADVLMPCYTALGERMLKAPVLHVDETRWPLWDGRAKSSWCVWGMATPDATFYRILGSKSAKAGREVLKGFENILVADGYKVYDKLARDGPEHFRLARCWAHVKRKFDAIRENFPGSCAVVLELIGELYAIERLVPGPFPGDEEAQSLRRALRERGSRLVLEELRRRVLDLPDLLPRNELGKAVGYLLNYWDGLTLFLEDPRVPLDNNAAERALRGPVVGRKNHYGSRSKRGTQVAAVFYSLLETAKLCGVKPYEYLVEAAKRQLRDPADVFLPGQLDGGKH